ncbi:MAG TPA: phosphopentomutase, partial [Negativicutes bacterium]
TKVCIGEHAVGRVIARPFRGSPGEFVRTANRHDYSIEPPLPTILDKMKEAGYMVTGIGKIADIFAHRGLTQSLPTTSNNHGMEILTKLVQQCTKSGLIMANLVDFDSVFGHRNDVAGYAQALETFDQQLGNLLDVITENDLVIVTADHGCDPTTAGTDHTREYVPLLAYACGGRGNNLGVRATFADIGATIAENFTLPALPYGQSFLRQVVT